MMSIDKQIGKFRSQIMGIAAIGVLLVHSNEIVNWPSVVSKAFGFGGTGVYIFVFLSAIGLYNSLKVRGGGVQQISILQTKICKVNHSLLSDFCNVVWYTGSTDRKRCFAIPS